MPAGSLLLAGVMVAAVLPWILVLTYRRRAARLAFTQRSEADLLAPYLDRQSLDVQLGADERAYLDGAVVFVIGAGGTIARQLVAQLRFAACSRIVLIDNNENGLYALIRELGIHAPELLDLAHPELANVRDRQRIDALFAAHRPDVVFHYANYKSASLGNSSPYGFVLVNVGGTDNVLRAVDSTPSVRRFVYISSDKAEAASQVYGRTKRVAELMVRVHAQRNPTVRFVCLRYCNVLDAAGSFAIPTFRQQIRAGAPVTVRTLPDGAVPDRYFISIVTAARLAIRSGAVAEHGNVLSLDERRISPLPIDELVRILARAHGVRNTRRWFRRRVRFVAADQGEKRSEALGFGRTVEGAPLVEVVTGADADPDLLDAAVQDLLVRTRDQDVERIPLLLKDITDRLGRRVPHPALPTGVRPG